MHSMGKTVRYEGFTIQSSLRLADRKKWQLCIVIAGEHTTGLKTREFLVDVTYATEQEADVHGSACGPRLIDGKVEGRSVMDLQMEDRRATPRFRVQVRTTVSDSSKTEGTGLLLDLSAGGCRMECSLLPLAPGMALELRIDVSGLAWPLMIDAAQVQWVSGQVIGLAFFRIRATEQQRLDEVIAELSAHPE